MKDPLLCDTDYRFLLSVINICWCAPLLSRLTGRQTDRSPLPFKTRGRKHRRFMSNTAQEKATGTCGCLVAKQPSGRPCNVLCNFECTIMVWKLAGTMSLTRGKGVRHKLTEWLRVTGKHLEGNFKSPGKLFFIPAKCRPVFWTHRRPKTHTNSLLKQCLINPVAPVSPCKDHAAWACWKACWRVKGLLLFFILHLCFIIHGCLAAQHGHLWQEEAQTWPTHPHVMRVQSEAEVLWEINLIEKKDGRGRHGWVKVQMDNWGRESDGGWRDMARGCGGERGCGRAGWMWLQWGSERAPVWPLYRIRF